jgi:alcohol dehydrogenase (NADP+)
LQQQKLKLNMQDLKKFLLAILACPILQVSSLESQRPLTDPQTTISQPLIGFGTWNLNVTPENTSEVVSLAIQTGYRQIDCAAAYRNEKAVGAGIADGLKKANLTRDQIWVTSKLWNNQ